MLFQRQWHCTMDFPHLPLLHLHLLFFHFVGAEKHPHHLNGAAALAGHPVWCFFFFPPPLRFDTQQERRCVPFVRALPGWRGPAASSELLGGECEQPDTIKGIKYNQACNGARWRCLKKS